MANRTEYEMLWRLGAELGKDFNGTFSSAQKILVETQREIQNLNKQQADISAYNKQQQAVQKTEERLAYYKKQLENVQTEMAGSTSYSSRLANAELDLKTKIRETEKALAAKTAKLDHMGDELSEAGIDVKNLTSESDRLERELKDLKRAEEDAADEAQELGKKGADAFDTIGSAIVATGILTVVDRLYEEFVECTDAAIEFESAVTGIYKTVDGTAEQLAAISDEVEALSLEIPSSTEEIAAVGEAAGQLGIATDDVMEFTEVMINLGETTNLSAEEAASSLAKFTNITKTSADEYSNLGSTVVALGNNFATTEADIVSMSTRLAASGTLAGLTEPEILALSAAMSSVGIEAEAGGTAMTQTFGAIEKAVASGGEKLDQFAEVSGMSADEFANAWQSNPIEALRAFIAGVGSLEEKGESAVLVLDELGLSGIRQSNMIQSLGLAADKLTGAVDLANNAWKENNALIEEAEKRYSTTESKLAILDNSQRGLQRTIGELFIPELRLMADVGSDILNGINEFAQENPVIVKSLVAITGELAAFLLIYNGYIAAKKIMNTLKAAGFTLSLKSATASTSDAIAKGAQATATGAAATAQTGLNAAMAANPIGLVLTGVAALTVGIIALADATKDETSEIENLSAASRAEYEELQTLKAEYEEVVALHGEASYQAQELSWQIEDLSEQYESGKQTLEEYRAGFDEAMASYDEMVQRHREENEQLELESESILSLVDRLEALSKQTNISAADQQEMLAIIRALNDAVPGLSLSYGELTNNTASTIDAVKALAEAELASRQYSQYSDQLIEKMSNRVALQNELTEAQENQAAAAKEYNDIVAEYEAWYAKKKNSLNTRKNAAQLGTYYRLIGDAAKAYNGFTEDVAEAQQKIEDNEAAIDSIAETMATFAGASEDVGETVVESASDIRKAVRTVESGYLTVSQAAKYYGISESTVQDEVDKSKLLLTDYEAAIKAVEEGYYSAEEAATAFGVSLESLEFASEIYAIISPLQELRDKYAETYEAAYSSITGQYNLWDEAAKVVVTDINTINTALETQNAYWSNYNTDLAKLLEKSEEIDGLSEVIASFADGSEESVNAIAGMAQANDESLREMVAKWQELQQQQSDATDTLVELTSDYESEYDRLTSELESIVDEWDLDEESAEAAKSTIDAYIAALEDGTADAVATAANIASLVAQALGGIDVSIPSTSAFDAAQDYINSHGMLEGDRGRWGQDANFRELYNALTQEEKDALVGYSSSAKGSGGGASGTSSMGGRLRNYVAQAAYASGTESAIRGVALVGEYGPELVTFNGGEHVFTAEETEQIFANARPVNAIENIHSTPASLRAESVDRGGVVLTISPTFHIDGSVSDDIENRVRGLGDELVEMVLDALEEIGIDSKRGVYA